MKAPQSQLVRRILRSESNVRKLYFVVDNAEKGQSGTEDGSFSLTLDGVGQVTGKVISERFKEK